MTDQFVTGQKVGDYEVISVLGAGGMGKVYKVRNVISDRTEAMKIVLANLAGQKELADRFTREIKLLASLNHPNIAGLRTALSMDNQLVMIMEYVDGVTLASRLEQGPIAPADAINYSAQILDALSYAHSLNVIHRDIKPANMMLTPQGVMKLMDFGIARPNNEAALTVTGTALGSLNYMSPEQVKGVPVDPRSDLYSLGVSLYEMVTGQLPFRGASNYSLMSAHLEQTPPAPITVRPGLPQALNDIILMSLAKDPSARFQSAEAFRNALASVDPGAAPLAYQPAAMPASATRAATPMAPPPRPAALPVPAVPAAVVATSPPASSSHRGLYMGIGALIVVAVLAAAGFYNSHRAQTPASPASSDSATAPAAQPAAAVAPVVDAAAAAAAAQQAAAQRAAAAAAQQAANAASAQQALQAAAEAEAERQAALKKAAELAQATKETDQLNARAAAASASLNTLRQQQAAQGLGLRGDISAAEQLLHTDLSRAQSAIDAQDPDKANESLKAAETQCAILERFLGR
jgi:eukaryotic-like serine/threonine-protein kinase